MGRCARLGPFNGILIRQGGQHVKKRGAVITAVTRIERSLELNAPIELVLATIGDVPGAAACLPGLTIGAPLDARRFQAAIGVQVGVLVIRYSGTLSVGDVQTHADGIRFRMEGAAPGGFTLAVAIDVAAIPRTQATSRLTIVNEIQLDLGTTLMAGPMIALVGGMLLDGFSRRLKPLVEARRALPARTASEVTHNRTTANDQ